MLQHPTPQLTWYTPPMFFKQKTFFSKKELLFF